MRGGGVLRLAGGQRDHPLGGGGAGTLRVRRNDLGVIRGHDLILGVVVHVPVILGADHDRVARLQFVDVAQRLAVAVAMARHGEVAEFPGHLAGGVVPHAMLVQLFQRGALHDVALPLVAEAGDVDLRDQIALRGLLRLHRRIAFLLRGHLGLFAVGGGALPRHGLPCLHLLVLGLYTRPPHLPDDVQRAHRRQREQDLHQYAEHIPNHSVTALAGDGRRPPM